MDLVSALAAGVIFALACNLDTVLMAVGQGARGDRLGAKAALVVAGVTTAVTFLLFGVIYTAVYLLTSRFYYRIVTPAHS